MKSRTRLVTALTGVVLALTLWSMGRLATAADIAHEVRQGSGQTSGFLELGLRTSINRLPIVGLTNSEDDPTDTVLGLGVAINGMFEWRGFFTEAIFDSFGGLTLGYRAYQSDRGNFEVVVSNTLATLSADTDGFESIEDRDADIVGGFRSTLYFPNSILQLSLLSDVSSKHNGLSASAQWGRFWQVRNWNLHAMIGARYFSNQLADYYFGVSADEVSEQTQLYTAGGGTMAELEFGATLPLSEDWIFRSGLQIFRLPDSVFDSPLTLDREAYIFANSISYVF